MEKDNELFKVVILSVRVPVRVTRSDRPYGIQVGSQSLGVNKSCSIPDLANGFWFDPS